MDPVDWISRSMLLALTNFRSICTIPWVMSGKVGLRGDPRPLERSETDRVECRGCARVAAALDVVSLLRSHAAARRVSSEPWGACRARRRPWATCDPESSARVEGEGFLCARRGEAALPSARAALGFGSDPKPRTTKLQSAAPAVRQPIDARTFQYYI